MKRCYLCGCDLWEDGCNYLIEKAFKADEVIFEYALCSECRDKLNGELSDQSLKLIGNYFDEHFDIEERRRSMLEQFGTDYWKWVDRCLVKDKPRSECEEFQLYGWCIDTDLVFTGMPYMLSSECIEDIMDLLSNETIGAINDFSDKIFGVGMPSDLLII